MSFQLPELPFGGGALAPYISPETLEFHHGKHHRAYVDNLNRAIDSTPMAEWPLERIIHESAGGVFNNAAQVWNHTFYWKGLTPGGGGRPNGAMLDRLLADFGSYESFREKMARTASTFFGSGWAWLVLDGDKLAITATGNADLPMRHGQTAVWTIDVWEHAYYVDYRNARPKYVDAVLDHLIDWGFVAANLQKAGAL